MSNTIDFYPVFDATGQSSEFIAGFNNPIPIALRGFKANTQPTCRFYPAKYNPDGGYGAQYSAPSGSGCTLFARLLIRTASTTTVLAETPTLTWDAVHKCYEGVWDLNTTEVRTAVAGLAQGESVRVLALVVWVDGSGKRNMCGQIVPLFWAPVTDDLPDPTSVTDTIFANLLEAALQNTNSIGWTRSANHLLGAVRRKTNGGIAEDTDGLYLDAPMPALTVSMTASIGGNVANPTVSTAVATVQGPAGTRYRLKLGIAALVELSAYTGGTNHVGDDTHFLRGGTPPANNYNRLTLQVSSPAMTYVLNKGTSTIIESLNYVADIDADVGATLTLKLDSVDGLMLSPTQQCTVTPMRVAVLPIDTAQADALLGITGNVESRLETVEAALAGHTQYLLSASTTDTTPTELLVGGTTRLALPDFTSWAFEGIVMGRSRAGDGGASFDLITGLAISDCRWAMSSDGRVQYAVSTTAAAKIYQSTDYGVTWAALSASTTAHYSSIACSADGTKVVAAAGLAVLDYLYTSADSGATWTSRDSQRRWFAVASSSDGTKLVAAVEGGYIYTSSNSGATWTQRASSLNWCALASSSNGAKLFALVAASGLVWVSTDSGASWTSHSFGGSTGNGVACSADGVKVFVTGGASDLWRSLDSGSTWASTTVTATAGVVCSSDGATVFTPGHRSTDSGATWSTSATGGDGTVGGYSAMAASADLTRILSSNSSGTGYRSGETISESANFIRGTARRGSGAASVVVTARGDEFGTADAIAAQADTTHGALQILATGGNHPTTWKADVRTVEITL